MQADPDTIDNWSKHHDLLNTAGALRVGIVHADFGKVGSFYGSNCIPYSRLLFAVDECGSVEIQPRVQSAQRYQLSRGSITFVPPNCPLRFNFSPGLLAGIHFYLEAFPGLDLLENETPTQLSDAGAALTAAEMLDLLQADFSVTQMMQISGALMKLSSSLASTSMETLQRQIALREHYRDLVARIERDIDARLTVAQLADQMGLTRDQLSKRFKRDIGEPLKHYLTRMLVRKSCELLHKGNNVRTTAELLHFTDAFYFSKFFKKHMGQTPSEYLAQSKIG